MKKSNLKLVIMELVLIIALPLLFSKSVLAADAGSQEDAVNWVYAQEGKYLDYDKVYGAQCVDLVRYYYGYFGKADYATGNGCDFVSNTLPENWTRIKNTPEFIPQPGDIAVWGTELSQYGHVAIVLSANENYFISMDQNWPSGSACKQVTHTYKNFWGVIRPNFNGISEPSYSNISVTKNTYGLHEKVEFSVQASNVDHMTIGIDKDGIGRVLTENCDSTSYFGTWAANLGTGNYSAYFTLYNGDHYIDTYRVYFSIEAPSYSYMKVSKSKYALHEQVNFNIDASHTQYMIIGIDKDGKGRVYTERFESRDNYYIPAEELGIGDYTAYISLYSTDGCFVDTERVSFSIEKPSYTEMNVSKSKYGYHEDISFSIKASQTQYMIIGIDRDGEGRVYTERFEPTDNYCIPAEELGFGDYTAYISLYSTGNYYVDTEKVSFSIEKPSYAEMNVSKSKYGYHEDISFSIKASQTQYMIIGIDRVGEGRVYTKRFESTDNYCIPAEELGFGDYTAYISLYSTDSCYVDTEKVSFSVKEPDSSYVNISKSKYMIGDKIDFDVDAQQTEYMVVKIEKAGTGCVVDERCDHVGNYSIESDRLGQGEYTAYFKLYSGKYWGNTEKVNFAVIVQPSFVSGLKIGGRASDALRLNWSKNISADGYIIEQYKNSAWTRIARIADNSTVTYRIAGLSASTTYQFRIKSFAFNGSTPVYSNYTYINGKTNPSAASGLTIGGRATDALRLNWTKNAKASGYIIEQYKSGKWTRIARIANNSTVTYRVEGLQASTKYQFRVQAFGFDGNTPLYSTYQYMNGTTLPTAVTGLKIGGTARDALRLNWNENTGVSGYIIEQYKDGKWTRIARIGTNSTLTYRVEKLSAGTTYQFRVQAFGFDGSTPLYSSYQYVNGTTNK